MKIEFTARHFKATEKVKEYAEKKVNKLNKYFDRINNCSIILGYVKKNSKIAEIKIHVYKTILSVSEDTDDIYKSIDRAVEKLERKILRYKTKHNKISHEKLSEKIEEPEINEEKNDEHA
jgi:putative sigma-54 modulation protein|tara:strand:- start:205 stop:564 length:360 start_codon:yes stop_codon:yes gene_type:complete